MNVYDRNGIIYKAAYDRRGADIYHRTLPTYTLDAAGQTALADALERLNAVNVNGNCLMFAFITDLHQRTEGIPYADQGLCENIQSIQLLSKLCEQANISAVFCGGDLINARPEDEANLRANRQTVLDNFNAYLPNTPVFITTGNHDKRYSGEAELITNEEVAAYFAEVNSHDDKVRIGYIDGTNYYVDFLEHKVRIIVFDSYDGLDATVEGGNATASAYATNNTQIWANGLNMGEHDASEWIVGIMYHGMSFSGMRSYLDAYRKKTGYRKWVNTNASAGKGYLGSIGGHAHMVVYSDSNGVNTIQVSNAYGTPAQLGTVNGYCFSVFVVDIEGGKFYEVRVGRDADTLEFDIIDNDYKATNYRIYTTFTNCRTDFFAGTPYEQWKKKYPHPGDPFSMNIIPNDGYTLDGATVTVTMADVDVTASVYANGVVSIPSVTGTLRITVSAVAEA